MAAVTTNNAGSLTNLFTELQAAYQAWKARRDSRIALNALTERELDDIGLCRADIDGVVSTL